VLKADVSGSLEAFQDEIAKLPQDEVTVQVIYSGVGGITESDVNLASASDAIILGFNVRPVGEARQLAEREGVEIRTYSVIYRAIDELRDAMQGMLAPERSRRPSARSRSGRSSAPPRSASSPAAWSPTARSRAVPRSA
jgi:translation initiation factor IF-2